MGFINWDEVEAEAEASLPPSPGKHVMVCTDAEAGTSNKGNDKVQATFTVAQGPEKGKQIIHHAVAGKGFAARKFMEFAKAVTGGNTAAADSHEALAEMVRGQTFEVVVERDEFQGEPTARIRSFLGSPAGSAPPPKKKAKKKGKKQPDPVAEALPPEPDLEDDDEEDTDEPF